MKIVTAFKMLFSNRTLFMSRLMYYWGTDRQFIRFWFKLKMGYYPDLDNPKTFNEKLQWLKLYYRKPIQTTMVDKYAVKKYVADIIGEEYIIPTLGVWEAFDDIDFDSLPNQFVLKCTHDSGGLVICKDKSKLDKNAAKMKIEKCLKTDFYKAGREWPYKNVPGRIIAEQYMVDESGYELKDYKWFCFDGEPTILFIAQDRDKVNEETKFDFYDMDFNLLPFTNGHPNSGVKREIPAGFEKMKELAAKLSEGMPHVRVDFYDIDGNIYFGEFTFFHNSGSVKFNPKEWDNKLGDFLTLPEKSTNLSL